MMFLGDAPGSRFVLSNYGSQESFPSDWVSRLILLFTRNHSTSPYVQLSVFCVILISPSATRFWQERRTSLSAHISSSISQTTRMVFADPHSLKISFNRSRLDLRKNFFSQRVTSSWNSLPQHVVDAISVNTIKDCLDAYWKAIRYGQ